MMNMGFFFDFSFDGYIVKVDKGDYVTSLIKRCILR